MTITTLCSDASVSLELGRRIALTEQRRRQGRASLSVIWNRLFARPQPVKLEPTHA